MAFSKLSFYLILVQCLPPKSNVEPYRKEIINLLKRRHTYNMIYKTLNT